MGVKRQPHATNHEETRSISYRLPLHIIEDLETEAQQKGVSQNVLVRQILEKYTRWERFSTKIGMIPVPKEMVMILGEKMDGNSINQIIEIMTPMIMDWIMFMKGGYDLKRAIESLEEYMKVSGMSSDHRIEGNVHHFIIQHTLGIRWSLFTELLLKKIFSQFLPNKQMNTKTTANTVIASIQLGSDFNEHDY